MYKSLLIGLLAVVPSSTNFTLQAHDFGTGADASNSTNYTLQGSAGSPGGSLTSGSYVLPAGIRASASVATPPAPTVTNPDTSYNRLRVTLNTTGMPSDARYLIAVSKDDFATTLYVQTDQTIGVTAGASNYQSYATWGGASGFWVLGLEHSTTYKVKVAALQGDDTGSKFGPTASASTVAPSVTLALTTSLTGTPPFTVGFGSLTPGAVLSGNATLLANITTNAAHGGHFVIKSQNGGLQSATASYLITSATTDLAAANNGYGAQVTGVSQSSGGPLAAVSPFDGAGDSVGALTTGWQRLGSFGGAITNGSLTTTLKAKANTAVPSAPDYSDLLTVSVSLSF